MSSSSKQEVDNLLMKSAKSTTSSQITLSPLKKGDRSLPSNREILFADYARSRASPLRAVHNPTGRITQPTPPKEINNNNTPISHLRNNQSSTNITNLSNSNQKQAKLNRGLPVFLAVSLHHHQPQQHLQNIKTHSSLHELKSEALIHPQSSSFLQHQYQSDLYPNQQVESSSNSNPFKETYPYKKKPTTSSTSSAISLGNTLYQQNNIQSTTGTAASTQTTKKTHSTSTIASIFQTPPLGLSAPPTSHEIKSPPFEQNRGLGCYFYADSERGPSQKITQMVGQQSSSQDRRSLIEQGQQHSAQSTSLSSAGVIKATPFVWQNDKIRMQLAHQTNPRFFRNNNNNYVSESAEKAKLPKTSSTFHHHHKKILSFDQQSLQIQQPQFKSQNISAYLQQISIPHEQSTDAFPQSSRDYFNSSSQQQQQQQSTQQSTELKIATVNHLEEQREQKSDLEHEQPFQREKPKKSRTQSTSFLNAQASKGEDIPVKKQTKAFIDIHKLTKEQFQEDVFVQQKSIHFIYSDYSLKLQEQQYQQQPSQRFLRSLESEKQTKRRNRSSIGFFYRSIDASSLNEITLDNNSIGGESVENRLSSINSLQNTMYANKQAKPQLEVVEQIDEQTYRRSSLESLDAASAVISSVNHNQKEDLLLDLAKKRAFVLRFKNFNENLKSKLSNAVSQFLVPTQKLKGNSRNYQLMRRSQLISSLRSTKTNSNSAQQITHLSSTATQSSWINNNNNSSMNGTTSHKGSTNERHQTNNQSLKTISETLNHSQSRFERQNSLQKQYIQNHSKSSNSNSNISTLNSKSAYIITPQLFKSGGEKQAQSSQQAPTLLDIESLQSIPSAATSKSLSSLKAFHEQLNNLNISSIRDRGSRDGSNSGQQSSISSTLPISSDSAASPAPATQFNPLKFLPKALVLSKRSQSKMDMLRLWTECREIETYFGEMRESVKSAISANPVFFDVISHKLQLNVEQFLYLLTHFWRVCLSPPDTEQSQGHALTSSSEVQNTRSSITDASSSFFKIEAEYIDIIHDAMHAALHAQSKLHKTKISFFLLQFRHLSTAMLLPKTLIEHLGGDRNVRKMMNELIEVFKNDISIGAHFTRLIEGVEEDTASRVFQSFLRDEFDRIKSVIEIAKEELNITSIQFLLAKQLVDSVLFSQKLIKPAYVMTVLEKFEKLRPFLLYDTTQLSLSTDQRASLSLSMKIRNSQYVFAAARNKQRSAILTFSIKTLSMLFGTCTIASFIETLKSEFNLPPTTTSNSSPSYKEFQPIFPDQSNNMNFINNEFVVATTPTRSSTTSILHELENLSIEIVEEFMISNGIDDNDTRQITMSKHARLRFQFIREELTQSFWHGRNIRNHGRRIAEDLRIWAISNFDNYLKHIQITSHENSKLEAMSIILKFYFYRDAEVFSFQDIPITLNNFPFTHTAAEFWMVGLRSVLAEDIYTLTQSDIQAIIEDIQSLFKDIPLLKKNKLLHHLRNPYSIMSNSSSSSSNNNNNNNC